MTRRHAFVLVALAGLWGCDSEGLAPDTETALSLRIETAAGFTTAADAGVVHIEGPTTRIVNVQPGETRTIEGLTPGAYTVALEALLQGRVESFAQTSVTVVAGQNRQASLTLVSFTPGSVTAPSEVTPGVPFTVQFGAVNNAQSYVVEWDDDPGFASPASTQASGTSAQVTLPQAGTVFVRVRARTRFGTDGVPSAAVEVTAVENQPPQPTISQPQDGATVTVGQSVSFEGSAEDPEDGTLTGPSLVWTSSIDGQIGTGTSFSRSDLSSGVHTITLTATDSDGLEGSTALTLTVQAPQGLPFAYVYAREPSTPAYTPQPADYRNLGGGAVGIIRTATGRYVVTFSGIGLGTLGEAFTVLVNAVADAPNPDLTQGGPACRLSNLAAAAPIRAFVECEDPSTGAAMDAYYRVLLVGNDVLAGTGAPGQHAAFSLHNQLEATATYTPNGLFAWNSENAPQTVTPQTNGLIRHVTGLDVPAPYTVGVSTQDGAAGTGGDICAIQNGTSSYIDVLCLGREGGIVNRAHFVLQISGGRPGTSWAYAFLRSDTGIESALSTSTGGSIDAIQQGTGRWRLVFNGIATTDATPAIMTTPVLSTDDAWTHCSHHRVNNDPLTVDVACYDTTLSFVETSFTLAVLR